MDNGSAAWKYHEATKHSELSLRMSGHYLDWNNKPSAFKIYKNLPVIRLPREFPHPNQDSLTSIKFQRSDPEGLTLDLSRLTEVLFFSGGLTRKMRFGSEIHYMRAASATGALYPIELYVVNSRIHGLEPGIYHFDPLNFSLDQIRQGDYNSKLGAVTTGESGLSQATIVLTAMAWRNSWKYEARSYRHWFWDAGVIAANLLATCSSEGIGARALMGFVDAQVDLVLGLRPEQEVTVALVTIGEPSQHRTTSESSEIAELDLDVEPLSREEVEYPVIWETNKASTIGSAATADSWRKSLKPLPPGDYPKQPAFPVHLSNEKSPTLKEVILRRGSTRRFAQKPISFATLSTIIDASTEPIPLDFLPNENSLIEFYLIANDVEQLPAGAYYFNRTTRSFERLKEGRLRDMSGYLCLGQPLFSDASVVFFLMTDLHRVLTDLGSRGYRAAQFEAGIRAGKIYLSSYAQGIGASGSTFYDDAVTEFFSPHAKFFSTMIAVGVGVPAYKSRPGKVLPLNKRNPQ